jgi:hypothetical protein
VALVVDITCDDVYQHLDEWFELHPGVPLIAMGRARSDRMLFLDRFDVFAEVDPGEDYRGWQQVLRLAVRQHRLHSSAAQWKERALAPPEPAAASVPEPAPAKPASSIIAHIAAAFRHFEHLDLMLDRARGGARRRRPHSTRVGLFTLGRSRRLLCA